MRLMHVSTLLIFALIAFSQQAKAQTQQIQRFSMPGAFVSAIPTGYSHSPAAR